MRRTRKTGTRTCTNLYIKQRNPKVGTKVARCVQLFFCVLVKRRECTCSVLGIFRCLNAILGTIIVLILWRKNMVTKFEKMITGCP